MGIIAGCCGDPGLLLKTWCSYSFEAGWFVFPGNWSLKKREKVAVLKQDMNIGVSPGYKRTNAEIAADVLSALKSHTMIPEDKIKVKVENAVVYLEGEVECEYQGTQAEIVIENLTGIHSVTNMITVKPRVTRVQQFHQKNKCIPELQPGIY